MNNVKTKLALAAGSFATLPAFASEEPVGFATQAAAGITALISEVGIVGTALIGLSVALAGIYLVWRMSKNGKQA